MKLLIADSDPLILRSLKMGFSRHNDIEVVGLTADSADIVDTCKAKNPNVVLLDIRLNSVTVTRQIKAHYPNVRVAIFSAFGNTPEVVQSVKAGADGFICKTDKLPDIIAKIHALCDMAV